MRNLISIFATSVWWPKVAIMVILLVQKYVSLNMFLLIFWWLEYWHCLPCTRRRTSSWWHWKGIRLEWSVSLSSISIHHLFQHASHQPHLLHTFYYNYFFTSRLLFSSSHSTTHFTLTSLTSLSHVSSAFPIHFPSLLFLFMAFPLSFSHFSRL